MFGVFIEAPASGTPAFLLECIKECISTPTFSISVNGELAGFFASKRGVRQGDPLSPLLFIIVMEALSRSVSAAAHSQEFQFHPKCEEIRLTHLSFADDIFLFSRETKASVQVMMGELVKFEQFSGLKVNKQKSDIKTDLLNTTGFGLGRFP